MAKNNLSTKKSTPKKKAIVPRGKHEAEFVRPRFDNEVTIRALADELFQEYSESDEIWLQDFFISRKITRKQIMQMRNKSEYFAEVYSLCKDIQESRLFHAGLDNKGNIQQIIFALKNVSMWRNEPPASAEEPAPATVVLKPKQLAESDPNAKD